MNTFGILDRQSTVQLHPVNVERQPQQGQKDPSIANRQSRVAQTAILTQTKNAKALTERKVTAGNLLSKNGLKTALGKASGYAGLKDKMMRLAFKLTHPSRNADAGFGSLHKSALRLAEQYQKLVAKNAPASERLSTLKCLETTLQVMQEKHVGKSILRGLKTEEARQGPIHDMLQFVGHEIRCQPEVHRAKAYELMHQYQDLVQAGGKSDSNGIQMKRELLAKVEDHLLTAREGGVTKSNDMKLLELVQNEIGRLKEHAPLESELSKAFTAIAKNKDSKPEAEFVLFRDKEGNLQKLKHVNTRQVDHVAEMSTRFKSQNEQARQQRLQVMDDREDLNSWAKIDQMMVNHGIENFDRSQLKSVGNQMRVSDGLAVAREEFILASEHDSVSGTLVEIPEKLPLLTDQGMPEMELDAKLTQSIADLLVRNEATGDVAQELGESIAEELRKLDAQTQLSYATSDGKIFKSELLSKLAAQSPQLMSEGVPDPESYGFKFSYDSASPEMQQFLDQVFAQTVSRLGDRQIDSNTLVIGGERYERKKELGEGSFGVVSLYESASGRQIAVKESLSQDPNIHGYNKKAAQDLACREVRAHYQAMGDGHPNVINLVGAVRNSDGDLLVAMELAPNGDVHQASQKIETALKDGAISQKAATVLRLTLLQDMFKGMQHMQETRGMMHLDVKPLNYFIGQDGTAMLGDFGTSKNSSTVWVQDIGVDNPRWLAPEVAIDRADADTARKQLRNELEMKSEKLIKQEWETMLIDFEERDVPDSARLIQWQKLNKAHEMNIDKIINAINYEVTHKSDTWALGITAYEMFVKELPFVSSKDRFAFQMENRIRDFGRTSENRMRSTAEGTEGLTSLDRLLNQMLKPDPKDRISLSDALQSSVFHEPGVGSVEARELIKAITNKKPDPTMIKQLSVNLGI
ncbi:hypothetical protein GCM10023213_47600 [Prosthecobacter algae]|uniref:Protein kinase domain-containing protein n=2 Tax=Prosthecobacter algae TaxID=1144682 RepID=A0ABP9PP52_9BACT